jgi:hypothetical protein
MKNNLIKIVLLLILTFLFVMNVSAGDQKLPNYIPSDGCVPDKKTALKIAEAVLVPIYGEEVIEKEKPFVAILKDGVWTVNGTLPKGMLGGVALVQISKIDGKIIRIIHGK